MFGLFSVRWLPNSFWFFLLGGSNGIWNVGSSCEIDARFHCSATMLCIHVVNVVASLVVYVSVVTASVVNNGSLQPSTQGIPLNKDAAKVEFFTVVTESTTANTAISLTSGGHLNKSNSSTDGLSTSVHNVFVTTPIKISSTTAGSTSASAAEQMTNGIDLNEVTTQQNISQSWQFTPDGTQFSKQENDTKVTAVDPNNPAASGALTTRPCCSTSVTAVEKINHSSIQTETSSTEDNNSQQTSYGIDVNSRDLSTLTSSSSWWMQNSTKAALQLMSSTTALECMNHLCTISWLFS